MFEKFRYAYLPDTEFPVRKIDATKCTKCGRCYETCPSFGFNWEKGSIPEPVGYGGFSQACLNCGNCIAVCPSGAISMSGSYAVKSGRYKSMLQKKMAFPDPFSLQGQQAYQDFSSRLSEVEQTIYTRRSNRLFKKKEVPEELLKRILEAGRFAPSTGNCQPYKFLVITNQNIIKKLESLSMVSLRIFKNLYLNRNGKSSFWKKSIFSLGSFLMINKFDPRPMTIMEKIDKTDDMMYFKAPAVIMILKDKRGISNPDLDAGICAQNMVLAAHSIGLGTCYISLPMVPLTTPLMARFRKEVGIVYPYEAVTSIAIGYPRGKIDGVVKRDTPTVTWIR